MLENKIKNALTEAVATLVDNKTIVLAETDLQACVSIMVTASKNAQHGDYATNAALILAKPAKKQPRELAQAIAAILTTKSDIFDKVEIAGPGFINLTLTKIFVFSVIPQVLKESARFGQSVLKIPKRVLIEFVSANPTGPIHLGHARGTFMGDALARLLRATGHEVTTEFYINDVGNQVETLGRSVYLRYKELFGESITLDKGEYPGAYIIDIAKSLRDIDGDKWLNIPFDEAVAHCRDFAIQENLNNIKNTLQAANVNFDSWYSERTLHDRHLPGQLIDTYKKLGMVYEADAALGAEDKIRRDDSKAAHYAHQQLGGLFLKTSLFGDEEDRILLRKNGAPVYLVADLAYHKEKYDRGFDLMINVFGADHANHVQRLKAGMEALGEDPHKLQFVTVQIVKMTRGGKEVRFSKRAGEVEELSDLIQEVGSDVARFVFLMRSANSQFEFDLDAAVKQSNDNPVFYVQYGHARMATLLRRAEGEGFELPNPDKLAIASLECLVLVEERSMVKKIAAFPEIVVAAAQNLEPHRVLYYCQELVAEFHSYFTKYRHSERIISDDVELTTARLALVACLKQTLFNALNMLGITAPEAMHLTVEEEA